MEAPSKDATEGRELRLFCPWASCIEVTTKHVKEQPLEKDYCRRIQVYCKVQLCTLHAHGRLVRAVPQGTEHMPRTLMAGVSPSL